MLSSEYADKVGMIRPVTWIGNDPWQSYLQRLIPVALPVEGLCVDIQAVRKAMGRSRDVWATWTYDWNCSEETEWWWTACDDPEYDVEKLNKMFTSALADLNTVRRLYQKRHAQKGIL